MKNNLPSIKLLGVTLTNASKEDILKYVDDLLGLPRQQSYIVTPNPEMIMLSRTDEKFRSVLNQAQLSLVDGVGLFIAGWFLGKRLESRFTGTDFMEKLCRIYAKKPVTIGFLGGKGDVAEKTTECLVRKYPGLNVVFASEEWNTQGFTTAQVLMKKFRNEQGEESQSRTTSENKDIKILGDYDIRSKRAHEIGEKIDILFVAFGFPKQEYWITEHLPKIPVKIAIGVGGAFDYLSGTVPRAPRVWQALGLEWLFRLIRQPWRWKRQLALFSFVSLVINERMRKDTHD